MRRVESLAKVVGREGPQSKAFRRKPTGCEHEVWGRGSLWLGRWKLVVMVVGDESRYGFGHLLLVIP